MGKSPSGVQFETKSDNVKIFYLFIETLTEIEMCKKIAIYHTVRLQSWNTLEIRLANGAQVVGADVA